MTSLRMLLVMTLVCGLMYPLAITGVAQILFPHQANGSLIVRNGRVLGSELIGRSLEDPRYFWPRPSATPEFPYNGSASAGSNLSPKSPVLRHMVEDRRRSLLASDPGNRKPIPTDLLTASGSGLDPHISPEAALWQVNRVARFRGLDPEQVAALVKQHVQPRQFGVLGEPRVNVLILNLRLDER